MPTTYGQFCPLAKAAEVFATRWTPLIVRELMAGARGFAELQRGIPLVSRAVLVARLAELERHGVVTCRPRECGRGRDYVLTPAGEELRDVMAALGRWGERYTYDRIGAEDLDPALLLWGLRRQVDPAALPDRRVTLRFEFSGLPKSRTKFRLMWLVLARSGVDVCVKDPGHPVDVTLNGDVRDYVDVYLGRRSWREVTNETLSLEGDKADIRALPAWLALQPRPDRQARRPAASI